MQLDNSSPFVAGYTLGIEPSGREHLVVAIKGTFTIPERDGDTARLAPEQAPLVMADEFWGEPGFSATRYEVDFALRKPRCDVLLNGSAYAPDGRPTERVRVGLQLGSLRKSFTVVGDRIWTGTSAGPRPGPPEPFTTMPINYDRAFGGSDPIDPDETRRAAYPANPVGRGFHEARHGLAIVGRPVPNTEETHDPIELPWGNYRPMSLGAIGRNFAERIAHAGTYDDAWLADVAPFLPADFDDRYYQAAPSDQRIDYLMGGETVVLLGLTPEGHRRFRLPELEVPVLVLRRRASPLETLARADTCLIEHDLDRLVIVWRQHVALQRDIFEIEAVHVGALSPGRRRAMQTGKRYVRSPGELAP